MAPTPAGVPLHCLSYDRCCAALLQLLLPLPPSCRSRALAELQSKLSAQLLSYLGSSLERVLESERGCQVRPDCARILSTGSPQGGDAAQAAPCHEPSFLQQAWLSRAVHGFNAPAPLQRFCRLPFPVVQWLLQHAPADRGETRECRRFRWGGGCPGWKRTAAMPATIP